MPSCGCRPAAPLRHPGQQLSHGAPASSISATAPRSATSSRWLSATVPQSSSPWHFRPSALPRRPFQQLPTVPRPAVSLPLRCPSQQHLPDGSPWQQYLCHSAPACQHLPDGSSLQRPCQQQTSSGREELRFG